MTSVVEKYRTLLQSLFERTEERKLAWELDWESEVFCQIGDKLVYLSATRDGSGTLKEYLEIKDGNEVIDQFSDSSLGQIPSGEGFPSYFIKMRRLRNMAIRQAKGADDALDALLSALKSD